MSLGFAMGLCRRLAEWLREDEAAHYQQMPVRQFIRSRDSAPLKRVEDEACEWMILLWVLWVVQDGYLCAFV